DCRVKIGIGKDDVWIFAAELERYFFEQRSACFGNFATRHRAACKRDGVDLRMRSDGGADVWARAMHNIEDTIRQTGFADNFAQYASRHRRQFAWLGDGSITNCNSRRDFPAEQI